MTTITQLQLTKFKVGLIRYAAEDRSGMFNYAGNRDFINLCL